MQPSADARWRLPTSRLLRCTPGCQWPESSLDGEKGKPLCLCLFALSAERSGEKRQRRKEWKKRTTEKKLRKNKSDIDKSRLDQLCACHFVFSAFQTFSHCPNFVDPRQQEERTILWYLKRISYSKNSIY